MANVLNSRIFAATSNVAVRKLAEQVVTKDREIALLMAGRRYLISVLRTCLQVHEDLGQLDKLLDDLPSGWQGWRGRKD